jgi:hypothetical protein
LIGKGHGIVAVVSLLICATEIGIGVHPAMRRACSSLTPELV